ncbi:hypothetical protein BUALT_Bualt13G0117300 [Buddleja alternifolia]|uniref:Transposase n=1 Tax=Buddleja alternifolia TaxID=168488 RepID=A0AAV6WNH8_9LAMI|nr:hypothetical protein BUALT_Bualt13G0117300 [Buddleja alternifolia]
MERGKPAGHACKNKLAGEKRATTKNQLHRLFLVKPTPIEDDTTNERWKWFKGCLSALDDTYIPLRVGQKDKPRYRNKKGDVLVNLLAVCDINMNYVYILSGLEGSAADSRVLKDAITRDNGFRVPDGKYYLCDSGYTNGDGFLAPYRGVRYHIQEWNSHRTPPQNAHELFNKVHARARNVIERFFALLKGRWAILRSNSFYPVKVQDRIIMACALLHNYIQIEMPIDPLEAEFPEVNDDIDDDPNIGFIDQVEPSQQWTNWRETLATIPRNTMAIPPGRMRGRASNVSNGYKADNGFKSGYQNLLEQAMIQAFPGTNITAELHINSRITVWRKNYGTISTMQSRSGFGWNDATNMITVDSEEAWNNYVKTDSNAKNMRYKTWLLYKDWVEIFGKDRATGECAEGFHDVEEEILSNGNANLNGKDNEDGGDYVPFFSNNEFEDVQSMSFLNANAAGSSKPTDKRKRKVVDVNDDRFIDLMSSFCDKTGERLGDISKHIGFEHDASKSRKAVFDALGDLESSLDIEGMILVVHLIVNNTKNMDLFFSLPNEGRKTMVHMILEGKFPSMDGD